MPKTSYGTREVCTTQSGMFASFRRRSGQRKFDVAGTTGVTMMKKLAVLGLLLGASFGASAQNYSFDCITNNSAASCGVGEAQLSLEVTQSGSTALFKFENSGPAASSITDIYLDWTAAFGGLPITMGAITDSGAGVDFSWGASPPQLPGAPSLVAGVNADSNPPAQPNGVNPGEWVTLAVGFSGSFQDLLGDINSGDLRIGIHVQGFANGQSEAFTTQVPEPETYAMLLAGLGLMGFVARRRRSNNAI